MDKRLLTRLIYSRRRTLSAKAAIGADAFMCS
jgi:hypothetical protein